MQRYSLKCTAVAALVIFGMVPTLAAPNTTSHRGSSRWGANYFPNVPLITHEGKSVRFFDDLISGKVVVINFIYTTCPDSCPLETARLAEVQRILGDRVGRDVFMYSITIDPQRDTPEVLAEYAKMYKAGPGWLFLTGKAEDITLLRKKLGLYIPEIQDGSNDHNLSLIIGNQATGRWMKRSPFENPYVLARQIGGWLHNFKLPSQDRRSYAEAPKLRDLTEGENLFRTRCTACHTVGVGDGQPRVGPNLLGATQRRDRAWLTRWLAAPDKMLAEKDSIAMGLFLAYNKLPMPNMRLSELEVNSVIEYLDAESRRVARAQQSKAAASVPGPSAPKPCCMKNTSPVLSASETTVRTTKTTGAESGLHLPE